MKIRKLKLLEQKDFHEICQMVFFDVERGEFEEPAKDDANMRLGLFDGRGKLQSALMVLPYVMRMNGHSVKMGGLGAVVTRPEARGKGLIAGLMQAAFADMREKGQIFSFVYPFSFEYYRNFGYETCYAYNKMKIPVSQLAAYKCEVNAAPVEAASDTKRLKKIYEYFTRERNLAIVRDGDGWRKFLERESRDLEFGYIFNDSAGRAVAYILYGVERDDDDGNRLIVEECCWITPEALHLVLGFLARLGAEFEYVEWNVPVGFDVLFPEAFNVERRIEATGMNRLVDVSAALATLRAPAGSGRVALGVTDEFLPENTGVYAVEWDAGAITVEKIGDVGPMPDMEISVQTLTQLVTGYITPEIALLKKDTTLHGGLAVLNALFPRRHLFITERF